MKQPDSIDIGTQMDIARYRLQTAKEDLDTAKLTYKVEIRWIHLFSRASEKAQK